jgi:DNA-binding transcriptional regulator LsrR (DeoR family)
MAAPQGGKGQKGGTRRHERQLGEAGAGQRGRPRVGRLPSHPDAQISESEADYAKANILAQVAQWTYLNRLGQKDIADRLGYGNSSSVARLLEEARECGVVAFDIDPRFAIQGRLDQVLGRRLRDSFNLDEALAVEVRARDDDKVRADEHVHRALGNQTGMRIRDRIQPAEHIAVGSGRAVYQTVRLIRRRPPSRKGVRITPLSARVWSHSWEVLGPNIVRPLDADDAAFVLALTFESEPGTVFGQIAYPLFAHDADEARENIARHCPFLPNGKWRSGQPRLALVGVGCVDPDSGHRFADLYRSPQATEGDIYLKQVAEDIKKAVAFVKAKRLPFFGDVTNRLFASLPLPGELPQMVEAGATQAYGELIRILKGLNRRMVVAEWSHLKAIPSVVAIAGGDFKLRVLWTLLVANLLAPPSDRVVKELTTDAETASNLLESLAQYERASSETKKWFATMVGQVFED